MASKTKRNSARGDTTPNAIDRALVELKREFPKIDETAKGIVYSVFFLANNYSRTAGKILEPYGLTWVEYLVLSTLRRYGRKASLAPSDISADIGITSGGLSNVLRRLQQSKLIERRPSASDGRSVSVALTAQGRKVAEEAFAKVSANFDFHLIALPAEDRKRLYQTLRTLVQHFERY